MSKHENLLSFDEAVDSIPSGRYRHFKGNEVVGCYCICCLKSHKSQPTTMKPIKPNTLTITTDFLQKINIIQHNQDKLKKF